jgi:hypothetical protein
LKKKRREERLQTLTWQMINWTIPSTSRNLLQWPRNKKGKSLSTDTQFRSLEPWPIKSRSKCTSCIKRRYTRKQRRLSLSTIGFCVETHYSIRLTNKRKQETRRNSTLTNYECLKMRVSGQSTWAGTIWFTD